MTITRIYYVGAKLSSISSNRLGSTRKKLHATIAYSRVWFPYKQKINIYPIYAYPPFYMARFGNVDVVRFECDALASRHDELRALGAEWDYEGYKMHVTVPAALSDAALGAIPNLCFHIEYYGTWEQEARHDL